MVEESARTPKIGQVEHSVLLEAALTKSQAKKTGVKRKMGSWGKKTYETRERGD